MSPRILLVGIAAAISLSACGEQVLVKGAAQATARAVADDVAAAAAKSASRAAVVEAPATRAAVVQAEGVAVTSEAAVGGQLRPDRAGRAEQGHLLDPVPVDAACT